MFAKADIPNMRRREALTFSAHAEHPRVATALNAPNYAIGSNPTSALILARSTLDLPSDTKSDEQATGRCGFETESEQLCIPLGGACTIVDAGRPLRRRYAQCVFTQKSGETVQSTQGGGWDADVNASRSVGRFRCSGRDAVAHVVMPSVVSIRTSRWGKGIEIPFSLKASQSAK